MTLNTKFCNEKASINNGYLRLANHLSEQFAARDFSETQHAILRVVERNTYGYQGRETFPYSPAFFRDCTGIDVKNIKRAIKALVEASILLIAGDEIGFNPRTSEWAIPYRKGVKLTPSAGGKNTPMSESTRGRKYPHGGVEVTPSRGVENTPLRPLEDSDEAVVQAPKEKKESIKERSPMAPLSEAVSEKPVRLAQLLTEAEWGEGELEKFLAIHFVDRLADLTQRISPKGEEKIREYLSAPLRLRLAAWESVEVARSEGKHIEYPMTWILKFLSDPTNFKTKPAPAASKVSALPVLPAEYAQYGDRPWARMFAWAWQQAPVKDWKVAACYLAFRVERVGGVHDFTRRIENMTLTDGLPAVFDLVWSEWPKVKAAQQNQQAVSNG